MQNSVDQLPPPCPPAPRRRLAFCITDLDPGGAEKALFQIVTRFDPAVWECAVYCLGPEAELAQPFMKKGISVHCYGARGRQSWGVFPWLSRELQKFQPCLLQCFLFHGNIVGRIAGRMAGVPLIVAGHRVAEGQKRWHLTLERLTRSLVHHHVCVSSGVAQSVHEKLKVPLDQISVIPNGVDATAGGSAVDLTKEFGIPTGAPVVLGVGRLHAQKGFQKLIAAFEILAERFPQAHLLILGEGEERGRLEAQVKLAGLSGRVHLPGYRRNIPEVMRSCSMLVLTSLWEGMPNVVLEAMSAGLPVVAANVPGVSELIPAETHGLVVSNGAVSGFAEAMARLLADSALARSLSKNAQTHITETFTWNSTSRKYHSLYHELLQSLVPQQET